MKKTLTLILLLVAAMTARSQVQFADYFEPHTLRFDFVLGGNADTTYVFFEKLRKEPFWGGSQTNMIDKFDYGVFRFTLTDKTSGTTIYSRGFNNLFLEWQTTAEARTLNRSFYDAIIMPLPKADVVLTISRRDKKNVMHPIFSLNISPTDYFIEKETPPAFDSKRITGNAEPKNAIDIVFLPEGYTAEQMEKFEADARRFASYISGSAPFRENAAKMNYWIVNTPSNDEGSDVPGENQWSRTALNSNFYTFGIDRYLTSRDMKSMRDAAGCVPYDQIFVIANSPIYGGGGIFNSYSMVTADNGYGNFVAIHELGHGICGLADEYYTSDVAYENYYDLSVEPWEPNITTMVDFDHKWKHLVDAATPIPTTLAQTSRGVVGAFEGGGYVAKGVYRPTADCTMKSAIYDGFCPVCKTALQDMIIFLTE